MRYVRPVQDFGSADVDQAGGKAANLGELVRAGLPVPAAFVVTTDAYRDYVAKNGLQERIQELAAAAEVSNDAALEHTATQIRALFRSGAVDPDLAMEIEDASAALGGTPMAVRSSATAEDLADASFAGQQDTYLNVDAANVLDAVTRCWASLWTARAMAYRARQHIDPATVSLAVVLQQLVDAEAAGVMFTANPGNGRRTELVIGAAWGLGESVVSGSVNTDDLVLRRPELAVLSRRTADKKVMTVRLEHGTEERPVSDDRQAQVVLDDAAAVELARWGVRIEDHFGSPQDIEWARTANGFAILQSRAITALPPPTADAPTDWTVPDRTALYFRASIVEQLPDPLTPLFADLIDGSVTRSLKAVMTEILGRDLLGPSDATMPTVNGYAYYAYSRRGMMQMLAVTPKALRKLTSGVFDAQQRWRDFSRPRYHEIVDRWSARPLEELAGNELLAGVVELLDAGTEYYTAVQTIIPIAVTSETLFTRYYSALVARPGEPAAPTFLLGFDSVPILAEKSLYDLSRWVAGEPGLADELLATPVEEVVARLRHAGSSGDSEPWTELSRRLQAHLDLYGHLVYNLDFANAVAADDPEPLIETLRFYLGGPGGDPYERQVRSVERREQATQAVLDRLDPVRRHGFLRLLRWAQRVAPVREDALADVGLAWPLLRRILTELGRRLVDAGALDSTEDVYWLRDDELTSLSRSPSSTAKPRMNEVIAGRQELWRGQRLATPPLWLPAGTWMDKFASLMPATSVEQTGDVLVGVPASAGSVTAVARVVAGPQDFAALQPGEILVAAITTPAWTSLFVRAGGVVTDIGGPLSHGSIVAREYGIPAVLGTSVATRRIRSGQRIRVDGDAGRVTLIEDGDEAGAEDTSAVPAAGHGARPARALAIGVGAAAAWLLLRQVLRRRR